MQKQAGHSGEPESCDAWVTYPQPLSVGATEDRREEKGLGKHQSKTFGSLFPPPPTPEKMIKTPFKIIRKSLVRDRLESVVFPVRASNSQLS